MNQREFTERTGFEPTSEQWEAIHTVYQFHPCIPDVGGKDKLASLFRMGGLGLILGMEGDAKHAMRLDTAIRNAEIEAARKGQAITEAKLAVLNAMQDERRAQAAIRAAQEDARMFAAEFVAPEKVAT